MRLCSCTRRITPPLDGAYRKFTVRDVVRSRELLDGDPFFPPAWIYMLKKVAVVICGREVGCFQDV